MASTLFYSTLATPTRASFVFASSLRRHRRLPLLGAFCIFSFGISSPLHSSASKTGCAQSLPIFPFLQLRFRGHSAATSVGTKAMEEKTATVPSIVVYVTVPSKDAGKKLAESIVRERLAACVNRVPGVESVYEWKGEIQADSEELLIIKTRESLLEALTEHVKANHEYEVPEVISLPITGGNLKYLEWIKDSTRE
ncbi:protein CutA, chloroplastic-like isoform X1 [Prosopis cineraria]|uniref:protein CutA, chloroplastic-like isoform X1 n=1 Tax=Prosopis cineraria TaxID=364024 RepID=UPI0024104989|nr:protein CutA, chloroplastic-like isoform X1 [Prosopis cineraria]